MADQKNTSFGIRTPPLLNYLQRILRGYSDGQILKELLQNAEDAGASEIHFLYDQQQYGTEHLLDRRLAVFQGPALCSYNNAVFKEGDWDAIQRPEQSGKKGDILKVGRFGIGFSSVYHLTDFPCIMSQSSLAMIDPFQKYFEDEDGIRQSGSKRELSEIISNQTYKDQLQPFCDAFPEGGGFQNDVYPATMFRFPLRAKPSKLCESVYNEDKMEELLDAFKEDARIVLLFLRKIETVKIFCQEQKTSGRRPFLEVFLEGGSLEAVRRSRCLFSLELTEFKENPSAHPTDIVMTNIFDMVTKSDKSCISEKWVVHQEIALGCNNRLNELFSKLNFLPWIGVAVPLFKQEVHSGRTFCFLPLPAGDESLSGLPVHVHGFFGVSDDRRSIKWPGGDQIQNEQAEWNKLLVDEILPQVYLKALTKSSQLPDVDPDVVYAAFPDRSKNLGHWTKAVETLYSEIFKHPILFCQTNNEWMLIKDVVIAKTDIDQSHEQGKLLIDILQEHGHSVVTDVPKHIRDAIDKFASPQYISPRLILRCLREKQQREFSNEDKLCLLDYLLRNNCSAEDLDGLRLLPVDSGGFMKISAAPDASEMVYIATETCPQELLPNMQHLFLRGDLDEKLEKKLLDMCSSDDWKQLRFLDVGAVLDLLPGALPQILRTSGEEIVTWAPETTDATNIAWLELLWNFLSREKIKLDRLKGLKVIPVSLVNNNSVKMAAVRNHSKLIRRADVNINKNMDEIIESVLVELGVTICTIPQYVGEHIQMANSEYVSHFTPKDILKLLQTIGPLVIEQKCATKDGMKEKIFSNVLPYLCGTPFTEREKLFIKSLNIFPQFQSENIVTLDSVHGMINTHTKEDLPDIRLCSYVCIHIENDESYLLLKKLGVAECSSEMLLQIILNGASQNKYSCAEMQNLLEWIHFRYETIKTQSCVRETLRKIAFVPNMKDELKKPYELFDRSDDLIKRLGLSSELLPKEDFFLKWQDMLKDLGLKPAKDISPSQIIVIAKHIGEKELKIQASALVEFLQTYPECLSDQSLCHVVRNVPILSCRSEPPSGYPPNFEFLGEGISLSKPVESFVYTDALGFLVGASVPLVESLTNATFVERLGIQRYARINDVVRQLQICVSEQDINQSHWTMLQSIYDFLNEKIGGDTDTRHQILQGLPETWIYLGDKFVESGKVYREETSETIDLRPFRSAIPIDLKKYDKLFSAAGVPNQVDKSASLLLDVLKEIKESNDFPSGDRVKVAMNILRRLADLDEIDDIKQHLLIPTNGKSPIFLPPDQLCYCDADWMKQGNDADDLDMDEEDVIYFVHDEISLALADKLGVMPLSQRLAGANEIGGIMQTGQFEPLTVRLKNILRDGYQPESIAKEMIQNAEDAGATSVKFLLDLRSNSGSIKKLLDPEMAKVHGPALWVYNDAVFSKEDLQNITRLGGATKSGDRSKIGQFGLGFNAVYHITDVPSFVTTDYITFFDPHRSHLKRHIRGDGTGIQLNFVSSASKIRKFCDQFQPYNGIFGCNVVGNESKRFDGTIFRLPLRSETSARSSDICGESYNEKNMKPLLLAICESASQMLLFTEMVAHISVYLLEGDDDNEPHLLYNVSKHLTGSLANSTCKSFKEEVCESMKCGASMPPDLTSEMTFTCQWTEKGKQYFDLSRDLKYEHWVKVTSSGKGSALKLCKSDIGKDSGLLPCGGVAWCSTENVDGSVFCFLPLSVPTSGLPVCINGAFAVASDRRSLWRMCNAQNNAAAEFKAEWNFALCEDVIVSAYITLLSQPAIKNYAEQNQRDGFFLWPEASKTNTDCKKVSTGFYYAVAHGLHGDTRPKVFRGGNGQLLAIDQVVFGDDEVQDEKGMFSVFQVIMNRVTGKDVLKLPDWVRRSFDEASCHSELEKITYSWERFFQEIFLPNFELLDDNDIQRMVTFGLSLHDKVALLSSMGQSNCIPSVIQEGIIYKKPSNLLDPDIFKDIYYADEGFFPEPSFLLGLDKHQMQTLRDIGCMKGGLDWPFILERLKTIQILWSCDKAKARKRISALLSFIDRKLSSNETTITSDIKADIESVAFLPAVKGDEEERLKCPRETHSKEKKILVGHVCYILHVEMTDLVCQFLKISGKEAEPENVVQNIETIQILYNKNIPQDIRKQWVSVYEYLQRNLENLQIKNLITSGKVFLVEETFSEAKNLAKESESVPPYLYRVPTQARRFVNLLDAAKIKDTFDYSDYIDVLILLQTNQNGVALDGKMLRIVNTKIIKSLFDLAEHIPDNVKPKIPLPDVNNVLHLSDELSFCDLEQFEHLMTNYNLCHHEIPLPHAKSLGVRDIREQMLKKYECSLPGWDDSIGESFGQKEELVNRLNRIMEGYPCDVSIIKEIVQNADDAKATKVHFILDCRQHPTERLFYDTMKEIQGPALLAFNNSVFSDDDIIGIQKLGEGSKGNDPDKTGRYGVGFNVVYHLTDCPMFLSEGKTLCIFDPTLKYVKGANAVCPGRMFRPVDEVMCKSYADIFNCFFSLEQTFSLSAGSLFRFPLRTNKSPLGDQLPVEKVKELLENFKHEIFDVLLFLKNVREISISVWRPTDGSPTSTYTVTAELSPGDRLDHASFFQNMSQQMDRPITDIDVSILQYHTKIKDNLGYHESWLVHQRLGFENKENIPDSVRSASTSRKLMPKGGVAARISNTTSVPSNRNKEPFRGLVFCFLPLPMETGLHVHVDGYFDLGHESRRNLWESSSGGDDRSNWNHLLAEAVIAPAFLCVLEKMKDEITQSFESTNIEQLNKKLQHYHSFFPLTPNQVGTTRRDTIHELCRSFYCQLGRKKHLLFPVILVKCPRYRATVNGPVVTAGRDVVLLWKSCMSDADNKGYFDNLQEQLVNESHVKRLRKILLTIGFPIIKTPMEIFNIMKSILLPSSNTSILKISPSSVLTFLKTEAKATTLSDLPNMLQHTIIANKADLYSILSYMKRSNPFSLRGLPLLLTGDEKLHEFSETNPVFHSKYFSLLPKHAHEFLHTDYVDFFGRYDECFRDLTVQELVTRLPSHLPKETFFNKEHAVWTHAPNMTHPTVQWVSELWSFLSESFDTQTLVQLFANWCIYPTVIQGEHFLIPMRLVKTVLSPQSNYYHIDLSNICKTLCVPITDSTRIGNSGFMSKFSSDIRKFDDMLCVFERVLHINRDKFEDLENSDHDEILRYFSNVINKMSRVQLEKVRKLPCFESLNGEHVPVLTVAYALSVDGIPEIEREKWVNRTSKLLLNKAHIPNEMIDAMCINDLTHVELYRTFILPHFKSFSCQARWEHLSKIMNMVNYNDNVVSELWLDSLQLIPTNDGTLVPASYFYDCKNPVFKEFIDDKLFPPDHPSKDKGTWLSFLRKIGLKKDVASSQFEEFLKIVSEEEGSREREVILVSYLLNSHHLHCRKFIKKVMAITFITRKQVEQDLRELHEQCSKMKVSLNAVPEIHRNLVWSTEPLLPEWVYHKMSQVCLECHGTVISRSSEPTLHQVLFHTQTLFTSLYSKAAPPNQANHMTSNRRSLLSTIIRDILKFLSKRCQRSQDSECSNKEDCCENCKAVVDALEEIPIIPTGDWEFSKVKRMTKNLDQRENSKLLRYIKQLPDKILPYSSLLYCLGATKSPSHTQYACLLELFAQKGDNISKNPELLEAAVQAMECFFRQLGNKEVNEPIGISTLHLLTKDKRIYGSTLVFYNDVPAFSERLKSSSYPFLKPLATFGVEQVLSKLGKLRPQLISENVIEVQIDPEESPSEDDCRCVLAEQMRKVFSWSTFVSALKCILSNDGQGDLTDYESTFQTTFRVACLRSIQTELRTIQGNVIEDSRLDQGIMFKTTNDGEVTLFISHQASQPQMMMIIKIAKAFLSFTHMKMKDIEHLVTVLTAVHEEDVMPSLSRLGLKTKDSDLENFTVPRLGSDIEEDVLCLLSEDPFADFYPNEYVGYNQAQSPKEHFVYAKVIRRIAECTEQICHNYQVKFLIDVGEEIEVKAIWLYKFDRPTDPSSSPIDQRGSSSDVPMSNSTTLDVCHGGGTSGASGHRYHDTETTTPPGSTEFDFSDLNKSKQEVTELIESLWREDESVRKSGLRRLMRRWHPDKHLRENKLFAEEIFKHIQREISRLENGIPSGVDSADDVFNWARKNRDRRSRYRENHERRFGGRNSGGWSYRGGSYTRNRRGRWYHPPPSFHRDNQEAFRWWKQAQTDWNLASVISTDVQVRFYQWQTSLCFFAAEKAIRAAQLSCGRYMSDSQNIMEAACTLQYHLNLIPQVQQLVQIVKKTSHYPDSCPPPKIPHEIFSEQNALEALRITKEILEKVDGYLQGI